MRAADELSRESGVPKSHEQPFFPWAWWALGEKRELGKSPMSWPAAHQVKGGKLQIRSGVLEAKV